MISRAKTKYAMPKERSDAHRFLDKFTVRKRGEAQKCGRDVNKLNDDNEKEEVERFQGTSCSICLSAFYLPPDPIPTPASPSDQPPPSHDEAQSSVRGVVTASRQDRRSMKWKVLRWFKFKSRLDPDAEQDLLTLKLCKHSFHAGCLVSWFLQGKVECPLCKMWFFEPRAGMRAKKTPDENV